MAVLEWYLVALKIQLTPKVFQDAIQIIFQHSLQQLGQRTSTPHIPQIHLFQNSCHAPVPDYPGEPSTHSNTSHAWRSHWNVTSKP